jgi:hypothetical protein
VAKSGAGVRDSGTVHRYNRACKAASSSSGGNGHTIPAALARRTHSRTVDRALPIDNAI